MRLLLFILFILPLTMWGQSVPPKTGSPSTLNGFAGGLAIDSFAKVAPEKDTLSWFGRNSDFIRNGGHLYFWNGFKYSIVGDADSTSGLNVNSLTFTGSATKTARITRSNGSWIEGTFGDNDNQTVSLSASDTLSISGGNSIHLPYVRSLPGGTHQSFTGVSTNSFTLSSTPDASGSLLVTMNNAWIDPADWSRSGNVITLSFTTSTTDLITIYYSF